MVLTYRSFIILYCLQKFNGERSISGIYHLLTGKKSSTTISDSNLYNLSALYGTLKTITRSQIDESIKELITNQYIEEVQPGINKYYVLKSGLVHIEEVSQAFPLPSMLNGKKYSDQEQSFWKKLSLLIQVLSNLLNENKQYIAIQQDRQLLEWVKSFLKKNNFNRDELSTKLYGECLSCLEKASDTEASIFIMRLTSSERIGYTFEQISSLLKMDQTRVQLLSTSCLHTILYQIEQNEQQFPLLFQLIERIEEDDYSLTSSTRKTFQYVLQGKTLEEIALIRNLKLNTIEDHIVEITHNIPGFSIDPYIPINKQQQIIETVNRLNTKQLKPIKESVGDDVSYFEIRLVLAKVV